MIRSVLLGVLFAATASVGTAQDLPAPASKLSRAVATAVNMQPAIPRPRQDAIAADRLAAFELRSGQKPNIVIFIVDDMGYGDPGAFGGGAMIGAATPNKEKG